MKGKSIFFSSYLQGFFTCWIKYTFLFLCPIYMDIKLSNLYALFCKAELICVFSMYTPCLLLVCFWLDSIWHSSTLAWKIPWTGAKLQWHITLTLVRMSLIKKSTDNNCWRGCRGKRTFLHCWGKCKLIWPLGRTVWRFLRKLVTKLPYSPRIPLMGIYPEETRIKKTRVPQCLLQHYLQ